MIRFLGMLVALFIVCAVLGYYRGWFHADSHEAQGHDTVTLTLDKDKLDRDKASAEQRLYDLDHK